MSVFLKPLKYKLNFYKIVKKSKLEKQIPKLPKKIIFCKLCVMSNQRPRMVFDTNGICSSCKWNKEKEKTVDWSKRKKEFEKLLNKYRKNNGDYDVIVPGSGGKDSAMVAHKLKYEYNMNPLYITWSPLLYTDIGFKNIQNFYSSGIGGWIFTPDRELQRRISLLGLIYLGNHFEAFGRGQMSYPLHVAIQNNIKLVMAGENGEIEYGGTHKNKNKSQQPFQDFVNLYHKGSTINELISQGIKDKIIKKNFLKNPSLKYYSLPDYRELSKNNINFTWFGYYNKWIPQENFYYVAHNCNLNPNPHGRSEGTFNKYASLDDATNPLHYYMSYIKFGIGRATADAAHEIREGHINRQEGIQLVKKFDGEYPNKSLQITLEYLGISKKQLDEIIDAFREKRKNLWSKKNKKWQIKKTVFSK